MTERQPSRWSEPWVLVIDDEPGVLRFMSRALTRWGRAHALASSGQAGLAMIDPKNPPLVVILDAMMPDMNGWEVARRIMLDVRCRTPSIIMVSALFGDELPEDEEGTIVAMLAKPFSIPQLRAILDSLFARRAGM